MLEQGADKTSDSVAVRVKDGVNKMAEDVETLTETRRYELNKEKTMKKKFVASTHEVFQLTKTGGV